MVFPPSDSDDAFNQVLSKLRSRQTPPSEDSACSLEERMAHYQAPGVSIAVVNDGRIDWTRGFGVCRWGQDNRVSHETLFQAASISKPVFALAVLKVAKRGPLDLDQDVNRMLDSWRVLNTEGKEVKVTIRQILGHAAGLTVHGFSGYPPDADLPTLLQILDGLAPANSPAVRVDLPPGTRTRYSGGGFVILQQVVWEVLGLTCQEFVRQEVFEPLGLRHCFFQQPLLKSNKANVASGHREGLEMIAGGHHQYPELAAAGMWGTPSDLAILGMEMQQAYQGCSSRCFPQTMIQEMLLPVADERTGMGVFLEGEDEAALFRHGGRNEGFVSDWVFSKGGRWGAVVMANSSQAFGLLNEILASIAHVYDWPGKFRADQRLHGDP